MRESSNSGFRGESPPPRRGRCKAHISRWYSAEESASSSSTGRQSAAYSGGGGEGGGGGGEDDRGGADGVRAFIDNIGIDDCVIGGDGVANGWAGGDGGDGGLGGCLNGLKTSRPEDGGCGSGGEEFGATRAGCVGGEGGGDGSGFGNSCDRKAVVSTVLRGHGEGRGADGVNCVAGRVREVDGGPGGAVDRTGGDDCPGANLRDREDDIGPVVGARMFIASFPGHSLHATNCDHVDGLQLFPSFPSQSAPHSHSSWCVGVRVSQLPFRIPSRVPVPPLLAALVRLTLCSASVAPDVSSSRRESVHLHCIGGYSVIVVHSEVSGFKLTSWSAGDSLWGLAAACSKQATVGEDSDAGGSALTGALTGRHSDVHGVDTVESAMKYQDLV
ncbi:hypothetical protein SprV_0200614700 [Sparganum proliferum]